MIVHHRVPTFEFGFCFLAMHRKCLSSCDRQPTVSAKFHSQPFRIERNGYYVVPEFIIYLFIKFTCKIPLSTATTTTWEPLFIRGCSLCPPVQSTCNITLLFHCYVTLHFIVILLCCQSTPFLHSFMYFPPKAISSRVQYAMSPLGSTCHCSVHSNINDQKLSSDDQKSQSQSATTMTHSPEHIWIKFQYIAWILLIILKIPLLVSPQSAIIIHGDKDCGALFVHINFQAGITHLNFLRIFVTLLLFSQRLLLGNKYVNVHIEQRF